MDYSASANGECLFPRLREIGMQRPQAPGLFFAFMLAAAALACNAQSGSKAEPKGKVLEQADSNLPGVTKFSRCSWHCPSLRVCQGETAGGSPDNKMDRDS